MKRYLVLAALFGVYMNLKAQNTSNFSEAIEDNSFLIEEAINQGTGVVQHISNGVWNTSDNHDFNYSITQEWPLAGQKHQISYTIPYSFVNATSKSGVGDIYLNYRYQLLNDENWMWCSPRLSFILPTGDKDKGFGNGDYGMELALPMSKRLSEKIYSHANLGLSFVPHTDFNETTKSLVSYFGGFSFIYLVHRRANFFVENVVRYDNGIDMEGNKEYVFEYTLNPALRFSIPVGNLEIVPGIGVPITFTKDDTSPAIFFYLSLEHPFKKTSE